MRISLSQAQGEAHEPPQRVLAGERRGWVGGVPSSQDLPSLAEDEPPPGSRQPPLPDRRTQRIREQRVPEVTWHITESETCEHKIWISEKSSLSLSLSLSLTQESGEFAEGLHAGTLPLRVSALPPRRPAEGPHSHGALRPVRSVRPPLPPPPLLRLRRLHARPRSRPRPAPHDAAVSHPDVPAQPQHDGARLPPPDAGAYLPQP